jgi:hypothetical protein
MRGSRISILRPSAAVLATVVAVLGVSTAASASAAQHSSGKHQGVEHFVLLQTDPNAAGPIAIASGPIHARGTDIVINDNNDVFKFPAGTVRVHHVAKHSHSTFDKVTCYGTQTETGTYRISSGTGAYDDAHGHGTYSVSVHAVGCDQNAPPEIFSLVVRASGPLHI